MGRAYGIPLRSTLAGHSFAYDEAADQVMRMTGPHLYRVEAVSYAYVVDPEYGEWGITERRLEVFVLPVHAWTPHGATLAEYSGARRRWVDLRPGAKQYASRTVREAVEQLAMRRRRQIYILERQLRRARAELALCEPPKSNGVPALIDAMMGSPEHPRRA